jgi:DNA-binding CsgD family transcriptional regulator/Tfp pilus assembly protein PilF
MSPMLGTETMGAGTNDGFVGRQVNLAELEQAFRDVESGEPRVAFVAGAAGIGKSYLLTQFANRIAHRGVLVLRTSCLTLGADTIPLGPMTAAVRQILDQVPEAELATAVPAANTLPRLLPELRNPNTTAPSAAEQADLFTAVLHRLGRHRLVVWVVDDLHACDSSTRELVGSIARTMHATRVMLVASYRDDAALSDGLASMVAELGRSPAVIRTILPPFSRGEMRELLTVLGKEPPDPAVLDQVLQRSGGNPFYAAELAGDGSLAELPDSLQALLVRPMRSLSASAAGVVRTVAIADRIDHAVLASTSTLTEAELTDAVHESVSARLVEPVGKGYRIRHALLAEAVQASMLPVERAKTHRLCAQSLERSQGGPPSDEDWAALALHWLQSGDTHRALPALLASADRAGAIFAFAEQARLLKLAMEHWDILRPADAETGARFKDICASASYAATWAGQYELVLEIVDIALERIDTNNDRPLAALLLAHRSMALHHVNQGEVQASVQRALQLLPADPPQDRMDALDYLAAVQTLQGQLEQARTLSEEACRLADEADNPQVAIRTATTLGWVLCELGEYERSRSVLHAAQQRTEEAEPDTLQHTRLWLNLAVTALALGDYAGTIDSARRGLAVPGSGLDRTMGVNLLLVLAHALLAAGKLTEADATAVRALTRDPAAAPAAQLHALRTDIALLSDDLAAAQREVYAAGMATGDLEMSPAAPWQMPSLRAKAEVALATGDPAGALRVLTPILHHHQHRHGSRRDRWEVCITAARAVSAAEVTGITTTVGLDRIRVLAAQLPVTTPPDIAFAAQFDAEAGDPGAWQRAAEAWRDCGHRPNNALSMLRAGAALLKSRREDARNLLDEALVLAEQTGARAIVTEVRATARAAHLELSGSTLTPPPAKLGLTQRELEILAMVADGNSNRQIGAALYISPKTVSVHVSNILAKLNVSSRGEAAALAHRSGLFR